MYCSLLQWWVEHSWTLYSALLSHEDARTEGFSRQPSLVPVLLILRLHPARIWKHIHNGKVPRKCSKTSAMEIAMGPGLDVGTFQDHPLDSVAIISRISYSPASDGTCDPNFSPFCWLVYQLDG